ncbi:Rossmann-like and DUF2520 domain-containing protein [Thermoanaerobacterium butyriciformans]|uniref:Short-subunit dehydrogenase-like oxidoreductase (DUF2520 family) n=1 Tax=Thermoanaerobacterium butyriciformans TaxID=1702242 RepID=A0ABS4NC17_9THEO|nr:Rossmann-like and DUF2520 domain-containing protein [Thermoanaerobacterium butyriciformans]MBP2071218.1 putative short-subunit dehydrogenase-like oxidoreductase (DUF2520 family) [Thermoanaerobacterium butyriciformans]
MKVGFIGAGKIGTGLGILLSHSSIKVSGYLSRSVNSSLNASSLTNSAAFSKYEDIINASDAIIISTKDDCIKSIVEEIIKYKSIINNKIFVLLSGSISIDVLKPLKEYGHTMIMHPVQTCPSIEAAVSLLPESYFTIEGDDIAVNAGINIVKEIGAKPIVIDGINKPLYHAACVMASNYLVTLIKAADELLKASGFPFDKHPDLLLPLINGTLKNISERGCDASLSGPIARCDIETVKKHVENINDDEILKLYKAMGNATIKFFKNPCEKKIAELEEIFNE